MGSAGAGAAQHWGCGPFWGGWRTSPLPSLRWGCQPHRRPSPTGTPPQMGRSPTGASEHSPLCRRHTMGGEKGVPRLWGRRCSGGAAVAVASPWGDSRPLREHVPPGGSGSTAGRVQDRAPLTGGPGLSSPQDADPPEGPESGKAKSEYRNYRVSGAAQVTPPVGRTGTPRLAGGCPGVRAGAPGVSPCCRERPEEPGGTLGGSPAPPPSLPPRCRRGSCWIASTTPTC